MAGRPVWGARRQADGLSKVSFMHFPRLPQEAKKEWSQPFGEGGPYSVGITGRGAHELPSYQTAEDKDKGSSNFGGPVEDPEVWTSAATTPFPSVSGPRLLFYTKKLTCFVALGSNSQTQQCLWLQIASVRALQPVPGGCFSVSPLPKALCSPK